MALLRLQNEANRLTLKPTKQSLKHQPSPNPQSELPLPRERFSPRAQRGNTTNPSTVGKASDSRSWSPAYPRSDADVPRPPILQVADFAEIVEIVFDDNALDVLDALVAQLGFHPQAQRRTVCER
jgi:hypothetical protein